MHIELPSQPSGVPRVRAVKHGPHYDVPWRDIAGAREILIHERFRVDLEMAWGMVHQDLPLPETVVRRMLARRARAPGQPDPLRQDSARCARACSTVATSCSAYTGLWSVNCAPTALAIASWSGPVPDTTTMVGLGA